GQSSRAEPSDVGAPTIAAFARGLYGRINCARPMCAATPARRAGTAAQPLERDVSHDEHRRNGLDGRGEASGAVDMSGFVTSWRCDAPLLRPDASACAVIPSPQLPLPRLVVTPDFRVRGASSVPTNRPSGFDAPPEAEPD